MGKLLNFVWKSRTEKVSVAYFFFSSIVARGSTASSAIYSDCVFSVLINLCDICVCSVSVCSTVVVVGFM